LNQTEANGFPGAATGEESLDQTAISAPPRTNGKSPFVPQKDKRRSALKDNGRLLFIGAGIVLVLLLLAFNGISRRSLPAQKHPAANANPQKSGHGEDSASVSASITPILDTARSPAPETDGNRVNPDQIGRTASKPMKRPAAPSLDDVRPFNNAQSWQPPPYRPGSEPLMRAEARAAPVEAAQATREHDAMDKASLVFVRNSASSAATQKSQETVPQIDWEIGLAPGTKLRARLESAISTAVRTPVVAVIEYNYEKNGEIAIPAGAKAFGHLESADRSGYVGIRFDSLLMPDGSSVKLEAAATDLELRPLRGKVEGQHTGKNILVRSLAGVGEITATLVGRGSLNQPLSEADLLRERVSGNIGQASDQAVANLALTERVVVSVAAGTEIYVVLQKSPQESGIQSTRAMSTTRSISQPGLNELRQLVELQRELNQRPAVKPSE
jgi:hypothetical protein